MDDISFFIDVITKVGFPIFVALYQMMIHTKATRELTKAVDTLTVMIESMKKG